MQNLLKIIIVLRKHRNRVWHTRKNNAFFKRRPFLDIFRHYRCTICRQRNHYDFNHYDVIIVIITHSIQITLIECNKYYVSHCLSFTKESLFSKLQTCALLHFLTEEAVR